MKVTGSWNVLVVLPCLIGPCFIALLAGAPAPASAADAATDPQTAKLDQAIEDWVTLLEKNDAKTAAARWAKNGDAAEAMAEAWPRLGQAHKAHDYRKWLDRLPDYGGPGAKQIGDAKTFTVGGHSYDHLHVEWAKGKDGWRVADVRTCR